MHVLSLNRAGFTNQFTNLALRGFPLICISKDLSKEKMSSSAKNEAIAIFFSHLFSYCFLKRIINIRYRIKYFFFVDMVPFNFYRNNKVFFSGLTDFYDYVSQETRDVNGDREKSENHCFGNYQIIIYAFRRRERNSFFRENSLNSQQARMLTIFSLMFKLNFPEMFRSQGEISNPLKLETQSAPGKILFLHNPFSKR